MTSSIAGLGTALPDACVSTELLISHAKRFSCQSPRQERVLEELYRRTDIQTRASVLASSSYGTEANAIFTPPQSNNDAGPSTALRMRCYSNEAGAMGTHACRRALEQSGASHGSITHLVTVSCTGFNAPGFDFDIINALALPRTVERTHVGFMGCHGAMNGLRVAHAYAQSQAHAAILLCAVELCSLHFQYGWSTDKLVANSLFSDGAAALLLTAGSSMDCPGIGRYVASASFIIDGTADAMEWRIGDHGFEMHLSARVPEVVAGNLRQCLEPWLLDHGLNLSDIACWAVHPGGPRILDAVEHSLSLSADALSASRSVLSECGNMSSPTVLFILQRLVQKGVAGPCLVLGFGPGLAIEVALLELF